MSKSLCRLFCCLVLLHSCLNADVQLQATSTHGMADNPNLMSINLNATSMIDTIWATAYQATVTLTNHSNAPTSSWSASFTMPQGQSLSTHLQNGEFTVMGQNVTVINLPNLGVIPVGGSSSFSMIIDMPLSGTPLIGDLQAVGNGSPPPPPPPTPPPPPAPPPPPPMGIEHSAWYIDWTAWFTGSTFVIPSGVNLLNIFVGELTFDAQGNPTLGGFGNLTPSEIDAFTAYCSAQKPPIAVKVSIGGSGGMYDFCWNVLTAENTQAFAQGMVDYCHAHGLVGVDFDYEAYVSQEQEALVGTLIKQFKAIDPRLHTSLCTNAGFGPNYQWQAVVKTILDAATPSSGNCAVDRLYIMSYYDPIATEENWILGWANWLKMNYNFTAARVSVGIDDFDAHAYDPVAFANWAASQGFSTAHWAFDPAHPTQ